MKQTSLSLFLVAIAILFSGQAPACSEHAPVDQLKTYLKGANMDGVQVKSISNVVLIEGEVATPAEAVKLQKVVEGLQLTEPKVKFQSSVTVSEKAWLRLAETIQREIGSSDITLQFKGKSFVLEGTAQSEFVADRAVEIARTHIKAEPALATFTILDMMRLAPPKP